MYRSEKEALQLLQKHKIQLPYVDVVSIVEKEGLVIEARDLEDDVSGLLVIKGNKAAIGYNKRHHENRQRFTIAHELGHYFLHRHMSQFFVDTKLTFYRDQASSEGKYLQEMQANSFAAELLMPRTMLQTIVINQTIDIHDDLAITELANTFRVSEQALTFRLANLNITG